VAVTKRYCIDDAVVNYKPAELLYVDGIRNQVYNAIFDGIDLKAIICKMRDLRRIGKDTSCEVDTLFYLQMLSEYMQIVKEETTCGSATEFDELKTEYKLDCIRNILTCSYGLGNLMDELIELLALRTPYNGISYMTISLDTCELFKVYGR